MNAEPRPAIGGARALESEAEFAHWVRQVVKGAAALKAFETGQIDAVMDPSTASAILLPAAQAALSGSSRLALKVFDALPSELCALDSDGTVLMTNKAWRKFVAGRAGLGIGVLEGDNFFAACGATAARERRYANAVSEALPHVLAGTRAAFQSDYVCYPPGEVCSFTLTVTGIAGDDRMRALVTRENVRVHKREHTSRGAGRANKRGAVAGPRIGTRNLLLCALPNDEYVKLLPGLEAVRLNYGQKVHETGEKVRHLYFPNDALVSLLTSVEGSQSLEVGLVGREGIVGSGVILGSAKSSVRALVRGSGTALRIRTADFLQALRVSPVLRQAVLSFVDTLMLQATQNAACNRFHVVEKRLALWLLMTRERLSSNSFYLTHSFLADMLGIRREGVTEAAGNLKRENLIRYTRGNITILDPNGLEAAACCCYRRVRVLGLEMPA